MIVTAGYVSFWKSMMKYSKSSFVFKRKNTHTFLQLEKMNIDVFNLNTSCCDLFLNIFEYNLYFIT